MEQDIYLDQIQLDRAELRSSVTDESVEMLRRSIEQHGLLQPLVVTPRKGGGYRLIAGRRRLTACKLLQYTTVPCRIIEDPGMDELPALAENLMRLNMNPLEEARTCAILNKEKGLSIAEICERTNHGTSWVQDRLAMLELPEHFQQAIADKKISIGAAFQLYEIDDATLRDYYLAIAIQNGATIHQVQAWNLDYRARKMMMEPDGHTGPIPQPPCTPPAPQTICQICDQRRLFHETQLLRICNGCVTVIGEALHRYAQSACQPNNETTDLTPTEKE